MKNTETEEGVVAMYKGQYWGEQYRDGHSTAMGFGPLKNANISNPKFCKNPTDMTSINSRSYFEELSKAKLVKVRKL